MRLLHNHKRDMYHSRRDINEARILASSRRNSLEGLEIQRDRLGSCGTG